MKWTLIFLFVAIFVSMTCVTIKASLDRSILEAGDLLPDPWFQATLCDAYCGFLTFFCWVAYKERRWSGRVAWFVAIMLLGNFAMSTYVIVQLLCVDPNSSLSSVLERRGGAAIRQ